MSPSSTSMPTPLGQLLSDSWAFCTTYWKPILIAAVVFGTVASVVAASIAGTAAWKAGGMMDDLGIDVQRMEDLGERIQDGDESAMAEMESMFKDQFGDMTDEQTGEMAVTMTMRMFRAMAPMLGLSALLMLVLWVISSAYFLQLSLSATQDVMAPVRPAFSLSLPLLGVWVWSFLRSFAWIPIIGIIPAIILGPRFALAPVILATEKKGVIESVRLSYDRTKGYWGKIVGNAIVAGLCVFLAMIVIDIVASILGTIIPVVGLWIVPVGKYITMAFMIVFMTKLSMTIMGKASKPAVAPARAATPAPAVTKKAAPKKPAAKKSTKKA
jgi:hypothetical protein